MAHHSPADRFTLPRDIHHAPLPPAGGAGGGPVSQTARAHAPTPDPSRRREGDQQPSHPAGRGWVPQSRDLGIPSDHTTDDPLGAIGHSAVFTLDRRIRFLDHLAMKGNVRAAAARVGVSHETAYRKRRQDAAFTALWDAAMVHARSHAEAVLASRALDGVDVPVFYHGEIAAWQVRHDTRLLLAHLARLDRKVEQDSRAAERAERFEDLLAVYAGHAQPDGFAEAAGEAQEWRGGAVTPGLPPSREDYVAYRRGEAMGGDDEDAEHEAMEAAGEAAGDEWDDWHEGAVAKVDALLEGRAAEDECGDECGDEGEGGDGETGEGGAPCLAPDFVVPASAGIRRTNEPAGPPESTPQRESKIAPLNRVTSVNPAARAARLAGAASPSA